MAMAAYFVAPTCLLSNLYCDTGANAAASDTKLGLEAMRNVSGSLLKSDFIDDMTQAPNLQLDCQLDDVACPAE